ncbi:hypothetical protein [Stenotrophomonas sp. S39]|uniref:hypothetical protein n=1 Tax=Stenotrophomonas sp. S39 TaxID=2767451 RepID=UPI00190A7ECB|nr:hypothetical protein [Stenotrophomonas sp. S39]MBK0053094.1 hypothetical protein [Stenotrophomonas sp. S39]
MSEILKWMEASLGPGVALLGVVVARAQWHTNDVKLRLDSYDRRLRVYKSAVGMLDAIRSEILVRRGPAVHATNLLPLKDYQDLPEEVVSSFLNCLMEAPFLFDRSIANFMQGIDKDRRSIARLSRHLAGTFPLDTQGSRQLDRQSLRESEARIARAHEHIEAKFRRHLSLSRLQN